MRSFSLGCRQCQGKESARAVSTIARNNRPTMIIDDALANRQSQTGSLFFQGEKRLEDVGQVLRGDACAGI